MLLWKTIAGVSLAGVAVTGAAAADFTAIETSSKLSLPVAVDRGFDWNGYYAGVFGVGETGAGGSAFGLGFNLGVSAQFDFLLVGAEVSVQGVSGDIGETVSGQILGRAGLIIEDDVLLYGAGGYGLDLAEPAEEDVLAGGGLEIAVGESLSLRGQYLRTFPIQDGEPDNQVTLGAVFHF